MSKDVFNGRAIVYGSRNRIMGLHEGLVAPAQIGPERKGVVASLAYSKGTLYHVERRIPITEDNYHDFQSREQFEEHLRGSVLVETLSGIAVKERIDAVADLRGRLVAVTSPENPEEIGDAIIIDALSGKPFKKIRNIRYTRFFPLAFLRISAEDGNIYVEGDQATAKYTPEESRRAEIILGTTDRYKMARRHGLPTYMTTDPTGTKGAFKVTNVIDQCTDDHVGILRCRDGSHMVFSVSETGEVYMATAIGDHLILGTLPKSTGKLYAVKTVKNYSRRGWSREVVPVLLAENAFELGEIFHRNNPITTLPSKDDLDRIVEKSHAVSLSNV